MDKKEYLDRLDKIKTDYEAAQKKLAHDYAVSNNEVVKGNYVTDNSGTIKVESITFCMATFGNNFPECIYRGPRVTKAGVPFKNGKRGEVYQQYIKMILQ